jgi:hypothetical protein
MSVIQNHVFQIKYLNKKQLEYLKYIYTQMLVRMKKRTLKIECLNYYTVSIKVFSVLLNKTKPITNKTIVNMKQ